MRNSTILVLVAAFILSLSSLRAQKELTIKRAEEILKTSDSLLLNEQWDSAYYGAKRAYHLLRQYSNNPLKGKAARISGISNYKLQGNDSTDYFEIAEKVAFDNKDWAELIETYYAIGSQLYEELEKEESLNYFLKIDSISQQKQIYNPTTVKSIIIRAEIARTSFTRESSDYAYLLLKEALAQAKKIRSQESIHLTYVYLCDAAGLKGEYENAKKYIDLGLAYFRKQDQKRFEKYVTRLYLISTSYYKAIKRLDKAEEAFLSGISYARDKENRLELAKLLYYYGNFQKSMLNSCKDAVVSLEEAKSIFDALQINHTGDYERLNRDLANCNFEFGKFKEASEYFRIAYNLKADLQKKANREISRRVERKYQTEKKEQEIALLNSEKELLEQRQKNQRNLLLGGIGLASLVGIFLFILLRNRQKTNKKLRELDQLKSNFFANISHEFRTPLTLISNPVEQKLESGKLSKTDRDDFEMIQRNSQRLLNLVDQLLDLSKLEAGKYRLQVAEGNLGNLISALAESFRFTAQERNIAYNTTVDSLEKVWFDRDVIEKVMVNLLSNAMKYTDAGGSVALKAQKKNNQAVISVENTASTIALETLEKLFDRFYQANAHAEGVGIGLSLVKELVGVNRGSIRVKQASENILQFEVVLPISKSAYKKDELAGQAISEDYTAQYVPVTFPTPADELEDIKEDDDRDLLLLAEDNTEVRQLLRNTFADAYRIVEAANGQEGVKEALEHVPDLIISDIMMPKVDGLKLCETLKTDERTSHIPIILLTAKAGEEDQYKGLSTGADAYVTKPFKTRMLKTRVKNLIASRKALRDRYSQEVILKPKDIAITNLDEIFLERVQRVLDQKLTESSFSIQEFSEAVGMSRMQLHRKLKALTGLSASEFVRSQRLKLAATMLQASNANVSEIGYQVGFNDPSYFTKCFREAYGVSPTEYSKKKPS